MDPTHVVAEISDQDATVLHLRSSFSAIKVNVNIVEVEESLPFNKLDGNGFERLCYQLILAEGKYPRFFGKSGSKDYGVDLVLMDGSNCIVYQCKNYSNLKSFTESKMKAILNEFKNEWLAKLEPKPKKFVLCIPLSLRDVNTNTIWTKLQEDFYKETKVEVESWDLEILNSKLKKLPDVVADLFSPQVAERFCNLPNWHEDIFRPVKPNSGDLIIKRYLNLKDAGRLYLDPQLRDLFTEKLAIDGSLLIQGLPGSGKSLTCLAFSEELNQKHFRVFYINMQYDISESELFDGIKHRLTRPSVFLFDNCQGKYRLMENLYDRLTSPSLLSNSSLLSKHRLVFISRTNSTAKDLPLREFPSFVENMKQKETLLTFQPTVDLFQEIIALAKPQLMPLANARLKKIYRITANDLLLLDQILEIINTSEDIDQLETENIYRETLKRYFDGETASSKYLMNLAALGQYDLAPPVEYLKSQVTREDEEAQKQLVIEADMPVRYYLIHSSAAELIYRALIWSDRIEDHYSKTTAYLIDYFKHLIEFFSGRKDGNQVVADELNSALRNRLKLEPNKEAEDNLKSRLLANEEIYTFIDKKFTYFSPAFMVSGLTILKSADEETYKLYCNLLERKINDGTLLQVMISKNNNQIIKYIKTEFPQLYEILYRQFCESGLSTLVQTKYIRVVLDVFAGFANSSENDLLIASLSATNKQDWENMIQRTLDSKLSIGTISFALQKSKKINKDLARRVEKKIGARSLLQLVAELGTIYELFKLIENSSITDEVIRALDKVILDSLVEKTVKVERSIRAIHLTLFVLRETNFNHLEELQRKFGVANWWKLVISNGDIADLRNLMRYFTFDFRVEMTSYSEEFLSQVWIDLVKRSNFKSLILLARWKIHNFSEFIDAKLSNDITSVFKELIATTSWEILYRGSIQLEKSPNSLLKIHLQKLLNDYVLSIDLKKLKFESFNNGINCLALLNRANPRTKFPLLFDIFPDVATWYKEESFLRDARTLFFSLTIFEVRSEERVQVLNIGNNENVALLIANGTTLDILLYLWNLYALWFEVESQKIKEERNSFSSFLHPEIINQTQEVLRKRFSKLSDDAKSDKISILDDEDGEEPLNDNHSAEDIKSLIALVGFLSSWNLVNFEKEEKKKIIDELLLNALLKEVSKMDSFLVASFYLIGLEWLFGRIEERTAQKLALEISLKKDDYVIAIPKALEGLHRAICKRYGV